MGSPVSLCPRPGRGPQRSRPVARQEDTRTRQTTANVWKKWRRFLVLQLQHREQGRDALRCGPAGQILQHVQQPSISNLIKRFFQKRLLFSDAESLPSSSPPRESFCTSPNDDPSNLRLPIFSRFARPVVTNGNRESAKSQLIFKTNTENVCVQSWHSTLVEAERGLCGIYRSESMMWRYTCSLSEQS